MGACHRAGGGPTQLARLPGGGRGLICHLGDREDVWVGLLLACRGRNIGHAPLQVELQRHQKYCTTTHFRVVLDKGRVSLPILLRMMKGLKEHFDGLRGKCYDFHSDKQG